MRHAMSLFLIVVLCAVCVPCDRVSAEIPKLREAEELLADRNYPAALAVLQELSKTTAEGKDELLFLTGNALFYQQQYLQALEVYGKLLADYPQSAWQAKALFKQADCYMQLKQFAQAEKIYEQEVSRLVSPERKERMTEVYLKFADEYFTGKWVERSSSQGTEKKPDYAGAKTFYELALQMELGSAKQETIRYQVARCAFELGDFASAITTLTALQQDYPTGNYVTNVIYYLGQAYLRQGQFLQARKVLRDFMEAYPNDPNAPEAAFLLSRTYNLPTPRSAEELELGVKALQDFSEIYHDHPRIFQAEYEIGLAYYQFSRYEDAIAAFQAYLKKYEGTHPLPGGKLSIINYQLSIDNYQLAIPSGEGAGVGSTFTVQDGLALSRYYLGKVYQQQRKFADAIAIWQEYLQKHPSDRQWSEVQQQIIGTEYLIADKLFREKQYAPARNAWEQFLTAHPLDGRNPAIMFQIGLTFFQEESYPQAIAQWQRTVSKYPQTDPASQAQYEIGRTLETKLSKFEEALAAYKQLIWGSHYPEAQKRIAAMQAKRLAVLTERVFRTNETPTLQITTRNIAALTLKMYKVDLATYFRKMQTTAGVDKLDIALIDPDKTWQETITGYEKYREFENQITLPFTEPGAYLITCSEETAAGEVGYEATTLVLLSDLDIISKTTKRDLLVFAQNMQTGETYADVKFLASDGKKIFFEGATGKDGVFHRALKDLKELQDVRVFAYDGTHYAATTLATGDLQYVVGLEARGYLYTDRPAYRPGQQVNIRGLLREVDAQGVLRVPQDKVPGTSESAGHLDEETEYKLQVLSSQGAAVYQGNVALNEFGSFAVDFTLSSSAPTGEYRIVLNRGKQTYNGAFLVEMYQLEKIKLTIDTDREVYFRGEKLSGAIKAEYYYGEPVKNKKVSYALAGIETLTGVTDETGKIAFTLDTRNFAESQPLTLTARLDDENVQVGKTVWLATRGFACTVKTIRSVYLADEDIEVQFLTKDPAGKPLTEEMNFGVFKRETTPYGDTAEVKILAQAVKTAEDGAGKTLIRIKDGGQYVLRAEGRDRFGNPVSGQTELFISGQDDDLKLRIITDKEEFRVGDQPEITVFSRAAKGLGLLTHEAEAILAYQVIPLNAGQNPLTLTLTSAHAPNFTLAVAQMEGNKFHQAQKEFAVAQGLNIAVKAAQPEKPGFSEKPGFFLPKETISVEITTTDQNGKPIAAEVSLAMVDEALYAQYAEKVPPIRDYFYGQRRGLLAKTDSSCTFEFSAETKAIAEAITEEAKRVAEAPAPAPALATTIAGDFAGEKELAEKDEGNVVDAVVEPLSKLAAGMLKPKAAMERAANQPAAPKPGKADTGKAFLAALREYFPETGYWNPAIVTDANGKAVISVPLPDSTTNWRFTSRGITKETLVGEATAGIVTKMPFFVELKTPAVFTEGDQATLLASIHNYSGQKQAVRMTFTGSLEQSPLAGGRGVSVLEHQEQQVTAEDRSVLETEYRLDLSKLAPLEALAPLALEFAATAENLQDRIKRAVPVKPWGVEYVTTKSGTLQDNRKLEIGLPGGRSYLYREMNILLNPSFDRTLVDLTGDVPWLFEAPASSAIHEASIVFNALAFFGQEAPGQEVPGTSESAGHLQARFTSLLTDIALRQNQDGGWSWTGGGQPSDLFVSADAVSLLARANRTGYAFGADVLPKGVAYLKQAFQAAQDNEIKTYLLYALAVAKDVDFAHVNRVYRERNALNTAGLALLTLICAEMNRPEIAAELLPLLQNRAKKVNPSTSSGTPAASSGTPAASSGQAYWPSDSAYAWLQGDVDATALALFALQKADPKAALIAGALEWLAAQRQWIGWGSTRTNARVSAALLEHLSTAKYAASRYILDVAVNDQKIQTLTVDSAQGLTVLRIPANLLKDANNIVSFQFEGRGALNYVCTLKGVSRDVKKTQTQFEVWRYYEPAPLVFQGKEIPRGFSVLDGSYSTWRNKATQVPLGGFGRVTLEYSRRQYDYEQPYKNPALILEEPIPAGCTVLQQSVRGNFLDYEIGDGKIVFYLTNANYGNLSYDLYGYLPGVYKILPTKIQAPYQPARLDYGEPYQLTVLGRGQAVTEIYRQTPDELYYYGKALFEAKQYAAAQPLLQELFAQYRLQANPYRDTAKMLLYIAMAANNSRDIVQYFEILKEKYPDLVISFADIIRVGQAYRDIQEYERAVQVFRATAEASFLKDVQVSGALEGQGEFLASVAYTRDAIFEYPDLPTIETAFYGLAQLLYTEAEQVKNGSPFDSAQGDRTPLTMTGSADGVEGLTPSVTLSGVEGRKTLLTRAIAMLRQFLTLYPENPIVAEVSFALANAYLDLEDFAAVIQAVQRFRQRYPQSAYLSGYQYMEGYANFELEHYEEALKLCQTVATSKYPDKHGNLAESDHKNLAIYIMGQIYHSLGQPEQAIGEYEKVKDAFPDAKEAIAYFTRKQLKLDEVTTVKPGEQAEITLHYRNVKDVLLLVYRVDLMKLYLLQKNLNNITNVNLAGISPYHQETLTLGAGKDYADKESSVTLPLDKEGAYLVVAKETESDASGMVLRSPLKLEVDEDAVSGRVRANVVNAATGRYENKAHVKVIGSDDQQFLSGDTDLRGIFIADNIHGTATVIARKGDQYAFYRGAAALQAEQTVAVQQEMNQPVLDMRSQATQQLRDENFAIQQQSADYLRRNLYQNRQQGVEVQNAY